MRCAGAFGAVVSVVSLVGCFVKVDHGTGFRCDDGVTCPAGQSCIAGLCYAEEPDGAAAVDGAPDSEPDAPPGLDPPWWDAAWALRRPLTVMNGSGDLLPAGFEVRLYADLTPLDPPPFDQLRVVRWDGAAWTEKTRVVDDFADPLSLEEQFWFGLDAELPAGATSDEYWVYYENPDAGVAPGEGPNVFTVFYDGFPDGPVSTTLWEASPTTIAATASKLILNPADTVRSLSSWGPGFAIEIKATISAPAGDSWLGLQRSGDLVNDEPWALWIDWDGSGAVLPDSNIAAIGDTGSTSGPPVTPGTAEHLYTITRFPDKIVFAYDGVDHSERDLPMTYDAPLQIRLRNGSGASVMSFENVRVRRAVDPEPVVTLGSAEARP